MIIKNNELQKLKATKCNLYLLYGENRGFKNQFIYENLSIQVKNYEPKLALYGGSDGLKHIRNIIKGAPNFLKSNSWVIIENHFD